VLRGIAASIAFAVSVSVVDVSLAAAQAPGKTEVKPGAQVEWLEYGVAIDRAKQENKHVVIDFYTNWCGWCKRMERTTYADSSVVDYLRKNFLVTKINAESKSRFKVGAGDKSGEELAREFGVDRFPITWFVKPDGSKLDNVPGYVPADKFLKVLTFVQTRAYDKK
jgi:thioredoxin-related protein